MKILLTVDGSICSDQAVEEVAHRPWPTGSEIKVIFAVEPGEVARKRAQLAIDGALLKLRTGEDKTIKLTSEIIHQIDPESAILDKADEWGANLIMVGSHGYTGLNRFILGSVSHAVAMHAKCSVEIVRCLKGE
jgi:nucleotide-binding universal stress UspA family protein